MRRRALVLALYAAATLALAWSAGRITLRADITDLLPAGTPSADDLRFYLERFGTADALFVALHADTEDAADDLEEGAARLSDALMRSRLIRSVQYGLKEDEALAFAGQGMRHMPVLLPVERQALLREKLGSEAMRRALERARDAGSSGALPFGMAKPLLALDPLGLLGLLGERSPSSGLPVRIDPQTGLFLSSDGMSVLLVATPLRPPQDVPFSHELLAAVERAEREALRDLPGLTAQHAGAYAISVQEERRLRHDITVTAGISMGAILLIFAAALRRLGLLLMVLVPLLLSTLWTLGAAAIVPGHLNMVTVAFAAILLGVGDDALTHLYLRFQEEAARGLDRARALEEAMASTGPSIMTASLTTGLSFAALTFVRFRGLAELGLIAAIGMVNLLACAYFLFPCLLSMMPMERAARRGAPLAGVSGALVRLNAWALPRRGMVLAAAGLVLAAAGVAAAGLRFSSDLAALRGADPAMDHLRATMAPFGGLPESIHLVHEEGSLEASLQAAENALPAVRALASDGAVTGWSSPVLWLPSEATQIARHAALAGIAWGDVAARFRAEAARLELREGFFAPFLQCLERWDRFEEARLDPSAVLAAPEVPAWMTMGLSGTAVRTSVMVSPDRDPAKVADSLARVGRPASVARVVADLTDLIRSDFRRAGLIALVMVALAAGASFRSARQMALVSVPVAAGTVLMLGGLALLGIPINLMNLVAVPMVFGLGIDFGVYIVNRFDEQPDEGIDIVLRHTGGAILLTGVTTLAGFGSLVAADFPGLRSMGWVALLGIGGCLAAALTLLPLLLPGRRRGPEAEAVRGR